MTGILTPALVQMNMPNQLTPVVIVADSSGTLTLVAGVAGLIIDVFGVIMGSSAASVLQLASSTGPASLWQVPVGAGANVVIPPPYGPGQKGQVRCFPICSTVAGDGLVMLSSAGNVSGVVYISTRPSNIVP